MVDDEPVYWLVRGACSGECCRLMTLSASPEQVALLAAGQRYAQRAWDNHKLNGGNAADFKQPRVRRNEDAVFVEENFVPVRLSYEDGVSGVRRTHARHGPAPEQQYRCKQWDGRTRRCLDYENRPGFCRTYGITIACIRPDCTLSARPVTAEHLRWENEGGA